MNFSLFYNSHFLKCSRLDRKARSKDTKLPHFFASTTTKNWDQLWPWSGGQAPPIPPKTHNKNHWDKTTMKAPDPKAKAATRPVRPHVIKVRFSAEELALIKSKNTLAYPARYIREAALHAAQNQAMPRQYSQLQRETILHLARIGNNLNQLAKAVNSDLHDFGTFDRVKLLHMLIQIQHALAELNPWSSNSSGVAEAKPVLRCNTCWGKIRIVSMPNCSVAILPKSVNWLTARLTKRPIPRAVSASSSLTWIPKPNNTSCRTLNSACFPIWTPVNIVCSGLNTATKSIRTHNRPGSNWIFWFPMSKSAPANAYSPTITRQISLASTALKKSPITTTDYMIRIIPTINWPCVTIRSCPTKTKILWFVSTAWHKTQPSKATSTTAAASWLGSMPCNSRSAASPKNKSPLKTQPQAKPVSSKDPCMNRTLDLIKRAQHISDDYQKRTESKLTEDISATYAAIETSVQENLNNLNNTTNAQINAVASQLSEHIATHTQQQKTAVDAKLAALQHKFQHEIEEMNTQFEKQWQTLQHQLQQMEQTQNRLQQLNSAHKITYWTMAALISICSILLISSLYFAQQTQKNRNAAQQQQSQYQQILLQTHNLNQLQQLKTTYCRDAQNQQRLCIKMLDNTYQIPEGF